MNFWRQVLSDKIMHFGTNLVCQELGGNIGNPSIFHLNPMLLGTKIYFLFYLTRCITICKSLNIAIWPITYLSRC